MTEYLVVLKGLKKMGPDAIAGCVAEIKVLAKTDEQVAHSLTDDLYIAVLKAIAKGAENPAELAKCALKAERVKFNRYCA